MSVIVYDLPLGKLKLILTVSFFVHSLNNITE